MDREKFESLRKVFDAAGQVHVFRYWETLDDGEKSALLAQLETIDPGPAGEVLLLEGKEGLPPHAEIEPLPYIPLPSTKAQRQDWEEARRAGEEALRGGKVGAFLAAGGQGARLGFEGPKGTFPIGPVSERSLFQIYAESVLAHSRRWGSPIPLVVMTSPENHEETRSFFADRGFFGLRRETIRFIPQRMLPAFSLEGKILMEAPGRVFTSPDGHGGALRVLTEGGALEWFLGLGIESLFYFQVDNPLLPVLDPAFIGHHLRSGSQFTTKVAPKTGPEERMGVFALVDGQLRVVEYIHLPAELARARDAGGRLRFWAGNVAVHVMDLDFVKRFGGGSALPHHVARKPARVLGPDGRLFEPEKPNALKIETFIFDAIPMADRAIVVEVARDEEFAPVKSAKGKDTPARARRMMVEKAAGWLERAGVHVPRDETGTPVYPIEISPLTALFPEDLMGRADKDRKIEGPLSI